MKLFLSIVILIAAEISFTSCLNKKDRNHNPPQKSSTTTHHHKNSITDRIPSQEPKFRSDGTLCIISDNGIKLATIEYESADTPETRSRGLMYRCSMNELQGMLFIYQDAAPRYMYMKNTYIPLDILFFDSEKKIIKIHNNTQPFSQELLPSIKNAQYALEVNAGFCVRHHIQEGDSYEIEQRSC